jgi:hypothetical protein
MGAGLFAFVSFAADPADRLFRGDSTRAVLAQSSVL